MRTAMRRLALTAIIVGSLAASNVFAQRPGASVQLPTSSSFSVGTSVSVPDQGSAYLGGVSTARSGDNSFGVPLLPWRPFRNSAPDGQRSVSAAHVTVTIHDFEALEEALLRQPTAPVGLPPAVGTVPMVGKPPDASGRDTKFQAAGRDPPPVPVQQIRAERQRREEALGAEAEQFFQRGIEAERLGNVGAARVYYQMASRRASGRLGETALARLAVIGRQQADQKSVRCR